MILSKPQNSKPAEEACGWGPQCPICTQSTPNIKDEDSEEDLGVATDKEIEGRSVRKKLLSRYTVTTLQDGERQK